MSHRPFVVKRGESHRPLRFAQRLREELSTMLPYDVRDPRMQSVSMITITDVSVTPDLKHSVIKFLLMGQEEKAAEIEAALNDSAHSLRKELMYRLDSKITPQLQFKYDHGVEHSARIHELLTQIKK